MTISEEGDVIYPWQTLSYNLKKEREQATPDEEIEIVPLKAFCTRLSPMGNLTITFNKPIILPPIRVDNTTVAEAAGDVTAANTTSRLLLDKDALQF